MQVSNFCLILTISKHHNRFSKNMNITEFSTHATIISIPRHFIPFPVRNQVRYKNVHTQ